MARIRIVLEVVDDGEDDFVIWTISAIEHSQLPFKDSKQPFNIAMLLTQNLNHVSHDAPTFTSESVPGCKRVLYTCEQMRRIALDQTSKFLGLQCEYFVAVECCDDVEAKIDYCETCHAENKLNAFIERRAALPILVIFE
jgi:hypothetical protein